MAETWATSGLDLHVETTGPGVRRGLTDALREAVRTGRLAPGTRLPSSRALAADLGIARNTVADAYADLVAEGCRLRHDVSKDSPPLRRCVSPDPPRRVDRRRPAGVRGAGRLSRLSCGCNGQAHPRDVAPHSAADTVNVLEGATNI